MTDMMADPMIAIAATICVPCLFLNDHLPEK